MEHEASDSFVSAARTAGIAAAIFFFVRSFVVEPYFIPSSSMAPTLSRNDHIAVEKFSKYFSLPHRGDMLVFTPPAAFFELRTRRAPLLRCYSRYRVAGTLH